MNVRSLPATDALSSGAEMWIIENRSELNWWQELDLRSCFLLTQATQVREKVTAPELQNILQATGLSSLSSPLKSASSLLLGTEKFFFNRWILLLQSDPDAESIIAVARNLRAKNLRFFSHREVAAEISTRPMASSLNISFIENI